MGGISLKMTPDIKAIDRAKAEISELSAVISGIVAENMAELVRQSPQRSGAYVASWYVGTGDGGGVKQPGAPPEGTWYFEGSRPAIEIALGTIRNFQVQFTYRYKVISEMPWIKISNPVEYADAAAMQSGRRKELFPGDPGNPSSAGLFAMFTGSLSAVMSKPIYVGKGTWNYYKNYKAV